MRRLLEWCRKRGIEVRFCNDSTYTHDRKLITLNWRVGRQKQLYHLLHECGHHLIAVSGKRHALSSGDNRALEVRLAVVEEEIEAWHRGRRLAQRLGIRLNRRQWRRARQEGIQSYVRWAAGV